MKLFTEPSVSERNKTIAHLNSLLMDFPSPIKEIKIKRPLNFFLTTPMKIPTHEEVIKDLREHFESHSRIPGIYILQFVNGIKIGSSQDLPKRLQHYSMPWCSPIIDFRIVKAKRAFEIEQLLLSLFDSYKLPGKSREFLNVDIQEIFKAAICYERRLTRQELVNNPGEYTRAWCEFKECVLYNMEYYKNHCPIKSISTGKRSKIDFINESAWREILVQSHNTHFKPLTFPRIIEESNWEAIVSMIPPEEIYDRNHHQSFEHWQSHISEKRKQLTDAGIR